jgi:mannose-1-phosphate guanylyltransferase/mannose-6-phosphate isomerase
MNIMKKTVAVILAGGNGERLWPLSRARLPKQLLPFFNQQSLLMSALERAQMMVPKTDIYIIAPKGLVEQIKKQIKFPNEQFIIEPQAKGTAGAVAAICRRFSKQPETTIILCNSDHVISPEKKFVQVVKTAAEFASKQNDKMAVVGIKPTYPETNFGYIITEKNNHLIKFHEKPPLSLAKKYCRKRAYWNSGYYIFRVDFILSAFKKYAGKHYQAIKAENSSWPTKFSKLPKDSIDYLLTEKMAKKLFCFPAAVAWWDVGLWRSMFSVLTDNEKNASGSVIRGPAVEISGKKNLIINASNSLLGVIGVSDLAMIVTDSAILVCPLAESDRVRELVNFLKNSPAFFKYL